MSGDGTPKIEHVAAYYNPASECAEETKARAELFQANNFIEYGLGVTLHETESNITDTVESLQQNVDEDTAVIVFAGDGSAKNLLSGLWKLKWKNRATIGLGGNAGDLAHQLHTSKMLKNPEGIFLYGQERQLRPLCITAKVPGQESTDTDIAFGYWGAGVSADGVADVATDEFRESVKDLSALPRFVREAQVVYGALRHAPYMTVRDGNQTRQVVEFNVLNGSREAKTMHVPTMDLLRPEARITEVRHPSLHSMFAGLARATLHPIVKLEQGAKATYVLESDNNISTQADGECKSYPSGTEFTFDLADHSVNVIATRVRS